MKICRSWRAESLRLQTAKLGPVKQKQTSRRSLHEAEKTNENGKSKKMTMLTLAGLPTFCPITFHLLVS
jgi:hypothetical protein